MNREFSIIAGPCSISDQNLAEIYQIAEIRVAGKRAIAGARVVGLKSRSELNLRGEGMGMDFPALLANSKKIAAVAQGETLKLTDLEIPPSVLLAEKIYKETNLLIATEIVMPHAQLAMFSGRIPAKKLLPWNPAVNQLGWTIFEMAEYARANGWHLGLKNGKWLGEELREAERIDYNETTALEKTWSGLFKYAARLTGDVILIHRGVDTSDKGQFRSALIHQTAARTKLLCPGAKLYFDPSHSYGPILRDQIPSAIVEAAELRTKTGDYLYDGILVEVGTSLTDTEQHISIAELSETCQRIQAERELVAPD